MLKRLVLVAGSTVVGFWLISDSFSFALYPPRPGRARGCYTDIEEMLHRSEPSDAIRFAEGITGGTFGLILPIGAAARVIYRRLRGSEISSQRI